MVRDVGVAEDLASLLKQQNLQDEQRQLEAESGRPNATPPKPASPQMSFGAWLGRVALIGLASPFLEVWGGGVSLCWLIGLVILFAGMRFAWRITAGLPLKIYGPFQSST